ncbi:DNA-directed RNA polymerase subunit beta [Pallidibacillus thermolactis]|uniref:DNA-directed RNA polymerase subunit beta n=1 Tax=Pallidibacillus thermolactis TaxID=251051 RepID=UPI002E247CF2|nr:DNA-directed RNA polymerase subunit beta [Pallidibacillus thermolactis subsp. kokeshiiformis]
MENIDVQSETRQERRQQKHENSKGEKQRVRKPKKLRVKLIPIWLRIIIVLVLVVVFFLIGAMIGYGVIGEGSPSDVFKPSTWSHITDIIDEGTPTEAE